VSLKTNIGEVDSLPEFVTMLDEEARFPLFASKLLLVLLLGPFLLSLLEFKPLTTTSIQLEF
jgi:hypothetical protein